MTRAIAPLLEKIAELESRKGEQGEPGASVTVSRDGGRRSFWKPDSRQERELRQFLPLQRLEGPVSEGSEPTLLGGGSSLDSRD